MEKQANVKRKTIAHYHLKNYNKVCLNGNIKKCLRLLYSVYSKFSG